METLHWRAQAARCITVLHLQSWELLSVKKLEQGVRQFPSLGSTTTTIIVTLFDITAFTVTFVTNDPPPDTPVITTT